MKRRIKFGQRGVQAVLSEKGRILIEKNWTHKGFRLYKELKEREEKSSKQFKVELKILKDKYFKNHYRVNPKAKIIKMIKHINFS